ncbi:hypothetical protein EJP77_14755 [Paenibacillus zeisoli]|uniref:Glycosyltransferase n=1 Tax=Paenibacillus zeisoli TaxID=2496267 RepID=A0A3S1CXT4_9BACL|nr:hypothetical protein [Paenibacillus zeisoli]RUT29630.1 hypothetical protein EJP77_14755 [Paenibacillus zeisoli]
MARALLHSDPSLTIEVYLGSLQSIFSPLFEEIGVEVIDLSPKKAVDHSKHSHLSDFLDWNTMLENYLSPMFYNSQRILRLTNLLLQSNPDVVVSDYDFSALAAAQIAGIPSVLVTERYNFTITGTSDEELIRAGFTVHAEELEQVRTVLNQLFVSLTGSATYVLTDKPFVEEIDRGSVAEKLIEQGKMKFVGPMIRPIDKALDRRHEREQFGIEEGEFLIVATMGGTAMFRENMRAMQKTYLDTYASVKEAIPHARMILIAREQLDVPEGVVCVTYVPNWIPLLRSADVVLAHPGWITVTEISALRIPTVFLLSSPKEYHELEAFRRLELLGYLVQLGLDSEALTSKILKLRDPQEAARLQAAYASVAPDAEGALRAAEWIKRAGQSGAAARQEAILQR